MQKKLFTSISALAVLLLSLTSCNDNEKFTTDTSSQLTFSVQEVRFDTLISTLGSSSKIFSVYNTNKKGLRASRVYLESRGESGFRVNVDGQYCTELTDVEILHDDSIMCFAEITPPYRDSDDITEITDRLVFEMESGAVQSITLRAWGRDVYFVDIDSITTDMTFTANRPYVLSRSLTIAEGAELTLEPGATLMFHAGAGVNVSGRIIAEGTQDMPVTFRGDRTDRIFPYLPYDRLDAQWEGIHIDSISYGNVFDYADIHSGSYGIVCAPSDTLEQKLSLINSVIHNVAGPALVLPNCHTFVGNSQISNSLGNCLSVEGGQCAVVYTTIAQFYPWNADRAVAVYVANHRGGVYCPLTQCDFLNCVLTGYADDELLISYAEGVEQSVLNYYFQNSMVNTVLIDSQQPYFVDCRLEAKDLPAYKATNFRTLDTYAFLYDFHLTPNSTARTIAAPAYNIIFPLDRDGKERPAESPDAGCYQY